jgi:cyclopropane-fatty-acyl-phospholipid synthase
LTPRALVAAALARADVGLNGRRPWDLRVHDDRFFRRVLFNGSLAFGEAYMDGWWDAADLSELFFRLLRGGKTCRRDRSLAAHVRDIKARLVNLQSRARARKVVDGHYNLDTRLFERMLGETMAYTCAYWPDATTLDEAQRAKLDLVCRKLQLKPGDRVLDIGCGFGSFARYAAERYGCSVVGINLSPVQAGFARRFCEGLPVEVRECDYREVGAYFTGDPFDRVVSIGMFEAVGRRNFRRYMEVVHRVLKDRGLWLLHTIGDEECSSDPWLDRYIFPNGELPSLDQIARAVRGLFHVEDLHNFGTDYARTLAAWSERFQAAWAELQRLDGGLFTGRFHRMWVYFLACCAGSFRARNIHLWQLVLSKGCLSEGYRSIR